MNRYSLHVYLRSVHVGPISLPPEMAVLVDLFMFFQISGSPNEKIWPGFSKLPVVPKLAWPDVPAPNLRSRFPQGMVSECGLALFKKFLTYDPKRRITCEDAMKDEYFKEHPLAIDPSMFPTWPAKSEMSGRHAKKAGSPKPPSGKLAKCYANTRA